jgi:Ca2+-binding EF-hand superfamily protein
LLKHNIDVDPKEIKDVIYDYDSNNDGELGLPEFCQLTLPSTNPVLRSVAE